MKKCEEGMVTAKMLKSITKKNVKHKTTLRKKKTRLRKSKKIPRKRKKIKDLKKQL